MKLFFQKHFNKINKKVAVPFILFTLLHILLFNVNAAEWGDSYRILRASVHLREDATYPVDEKRPPLFSILLSTYPNFSGEGVFIDPVIWGRFVMLLISVFSFVLFYYLVINLLGNNNQVTQKIALILFALNPIYLYWSLRIMADVPFATFVLLSMCLITSLKKSSNYLKIAFLGLIVGLSVYTRFEGYILFGAIGLGLLFSKGIGGFEDFSVDFVIKSIKDNINNIVVYVVSFISTLIPYFIWRNPFSSTYFEEPAGRAYDLNTLIIYLISFAFLFGFVPAMFFVVRGINFYKKYFFENVAIFAFVIVELLLVLSWPAAVPRLFVPIIPLLIIPLADSIYEYFLGDSADLTRVNKLKYLLLKINFLKRIDFDINSILILLFLFIFYVVGQFVFKLQFLIVSKPIFIIVTLLQLALVLSTIKRNVYAFLSVMLLTLVIWSFSTIWVHKDIHTVVSSANEFVSETLCGKIASNDVSSVTDWYQNEMPGNSCTKSFYYDLTIRENREKDELLEQNIDYALVTNEHNTDMTFDIAEWPHLEIIAEFSKEINGKTFFTKIVKFNKNT